MPRAAACRIELRTQIERKGPAPSGGTPQPVHDFRTNFIATAANPHPTMHYHIRSRAPVAPRRRGHR